jgi:hypothetical protein
MRALLVAAVVFVAALAGCSGKKGDDDHDHLTYTCSNGKVISEEDYEDVLENVTVDFLKTKCPKNGGTGTGNTTGGTTLAPNKLPVLMMNVTDFGGNATMVTLLNGNLTFSAAGSSDPDGMITAIAISVTDSNTTRTKSLYNAATKSFTPANFKFDRAGRVNVSVQMVDDRAGFNGSVFQVYVNQQQTLGNSQLSGPPGGPADSEVTDPCRGAQGGDLGASGAIIDGAYFKLATINTAQAPSFIEAVPGEDTLVTICDPDGNAISSPTKSSDPVITNNEEPLPMPASGIKNYGVGLYAGSAQVTVTVLVTVHYEPKPAAAA